MNLNSHTMCAWNAVTMTAKKSLKRLEDTETIWAGIEHLPNFFADRSGKVENSSRRYGR